MGDDVAIRVDDLRRSFGATEAVRGVSFRIARGEIYGLLGPNGAGKTTTLRVLATLLRPSAGRALIAGRDVAEQPLAVRRRLGYLTGDTGLYRRLTPAQLLRYFGRLYGMEAGPLRARCDELIEALGITRYRDRPCGALSTGERQRVSIARAVLHDPEVLVLDEPTSGLDILAAQTMHDFLRGARDRGKAILLSTHVMAEAELLCDRIGLLHLGRLLDEGTVAEIRRRQDAETLAEAFLAAVRGHAAAAGGASPVATPAGEGVR